MLSVIFKFYTLTSVDEINWLVRVCMTLVQYCWWDQSKSRQYIPKR